MNSYLVKFAAVTLAIGLAITSLGSTADAQIVYPAYRIVYKTVYDEQPVTTYRLQHETHYREQVVTTRKPVWETETRVRRYKVEKPVYETSTQIQRQTVRKPVWETETRTQRRVVQRPVTEQVLQDRSYTVVEPVTTMRTEVVDQGSYVNQYVEVPGAVRNRLRWVQGGYVTDPTTGALVYQRPGFYWVPQQSAATVQVQTQYVPNYVQRQVPQTTYQQKVVQEQVPVNVTRYQTEYVDQPYEVKVQKWVDEVVETPIQVTTQKIQTEIREEPVEVRVCKWITEQQTVQTPYTVAKWVAETTTRRVPRTVAMRVPVDPCTGHSVYYPPATITYHAPSAEAVIVSPEPPVVKKEVQPAEEPAERDAEDADSQEPADVAPQLPSNVQITPIPLDDDDFEDQPPTPGDDGVAGEDGNSA